MIDERAQETDSGYENKARRIARELGLRVAVVMHPQQECPKWSEKQGKLCDHIHGNRYRVSLMRQDQRKRLSFDFWNSKHDADKGRDPGYYDVLACVASDASMSTDPDELAADLGPMPPSRALTAAQFARRLQRFFTDTELRKLGEVDS
jgi:hypothetical protein